MNEDMTPERQAAMRLLGSAVTAVETLLQVSPNARFAVVVWVDGQEGNPDAISVGTVTGHEAQLPRAMKSAVKQIAAVQKLNKASS